MFAQKTKEDMSLKKLKNIQILHFILTGMTDVQTESVWIWERSGVQLSSDLNNVIWNQAEIYIQSAPNNSNETHTFMCLGRASHFGQH